MELPAPYDGTAPFFFVSYKRDDWARIAPMVVLIGGHGFRVWYDRGIPGGAEWDALIEERVHACRWLLVFLSAAAMQSKHVRREVKFADRLDKPIVTVRLEEVPLGQGLEMLLGQYQMLDAGDADFEARLIRSLEELRSAAPEEERVLARLEFVSGPLAGTSIALTPETTSLQIGRHRNCDVCIPEASLSSFHAVVRRIPSGFALIDLRSRNGTYVNGARIRDAILADGDMILWGTTELRFRFLRPESFREEAEPPRDGHRVSTDGPHGFIPYGTDEAAPTVTFHESLRSAPSAAPIARLEHVRGAAVCQGLDLFESTKPLLFGRHAECEVSVEDPKVSGAHATLTRTDEGFELVDLETRNGTWVNGKRVPQTILRNGDSIRMGVVSFRFRRF